MLHLKSRAEDIERQAFVGSERDQKGAYLELHSGAGGVESMDWCALLFRMYTRYGYAPFFGNIIQRIFPVGLNNIPIKWILWMRIKEKLRVFVQER